MYLGLSPPGFQRVAAHNPARNQGEPGREIELLEAERPDRRAAVRPQRPATAIDTEAIDKARLQESRRNRAAALLKAGLVDRLSIYRGGRALGAEGRSAVGPLGLQKLDFAPRFSLVSSRVVGGDTLETWRRGT